LPLREVNGRPGQLEARPGAGRFEGAHALRLRQGQGRHLELHGQCATNWPALEATGSPTAGAGIDSSLLGTITRSDDGSTQVTYKKQPLYYFAGDSKAGDVNGQNVGGIWFVVGADGAPNKATS
jgi:hypothetical protein